MLGRFINVNSLRILGRVGRADDDQRRLANKRPLKRLIFYQLIFA